MSPLLAGAARRAGGDARPIPAHPYRDAALVYAVMAIVLVIVATTTGGDFLKAMLAALIFFALATGWSWWRFRVRIRERDAAADRRSPEPRGRNGERKRTRRAG